MTPDNDNAGCAPCPHCNGYGYLTGLANSEEPGPYAGDCCRCKGSGVAICFECGARLTLDDEECSVDGHPATWLCSACRALEESSICWSCQREPPVGMRDGHPLCEACLPVPTEDDTLPDLARPLAATLELIEDARAHGVPVRTALRLLRKYVQLARKGERV